MSPKADTPSSVPLIFSSEERPSLTQQGPVVEIRLPGAAVLVFPGADAETLRAVCCDARVQGVLVLIAPNNTRIFLCTDDTDMRKSFSSLSGVIRKSMNLDALSAT